MDAALSTPQPRGWKREVAPGVTLRRWIFDLLFGVVGPLLCLIFDPAVFKGEMGGLMSLVRVFAYTSIGIGLVTLTIWLVFGTRFQWGRSIIAGILMFGALFAFLLGLVMLPLTILGVFIAGIGLLGFLPFVTGFIYLRNGRRALGSATQLPIDKALRMAGGFLCGIALVIAIPVAVQWQTSRYVSQSVDAILNGDSLAAGQGVENLQHAFWCTETCYTPIVQAYRNTGDSARQQFLAAAYQQISGNTIQSASLALSD